MHSNHIHVDTISPSAETMLAFFESLCKIWRTADLTYGKLMVNVRENDKIARSISLRMQEVEGVGPCGWCRCLGCRRYRSSALSIGVVLLPRFVKFTQRLHSRPFLLQHPHHHLLALQITRIYTSIDLTKKLSPFDHVIHEQRRSKASNHFSHGNGGPWASAY